MRGLAKVVVAGVLALGLAGGPLAHAQDKKGDDKGAAKSDYDLTPFPADASIKQVTHVAGKTLNYTATVGSLPVRDDKGKKIGEVVFTAYTLDGPRDPYRPVTFAFNGGPGAASVYLNLGAIGPKRVQFGAEGDSASAPVRLDDNPGTWMDFSDLVFIDPIGTGFSRALVGDDEAKKAFYSVKPDIAYLSRIVFDWLVKNGRMASPKYVVGESYGGFRAPRIAHYLQTELGVGVNGVVMVSPFLDAKAEADGDFSPMPWVITLPSMAAANLEKQGRLTPEAMAPIEAYARGQYALDLLKGRTDPAALEAMVQKVAGYTGLDVALVRKLGGRVDIGTFLRESHRNQEKIGSVYDSNVTGYDPFPWSADRQSGDPILNSIIAPTTSAMVDFVTRTVGWKVDGRYNALSNRVNELWEDGWYRDAESVTDFRKAVANDPKMKVLIVHGYDDLSCPFFTSRLIVDQMPPMGAPGRVQLKVYPGGHMFYSRPDSMAALRRDVMALYGVG
ncbi:carboxypeptidase C (cathepsin A) [Caulobacter ginsengisoli]|uniref:Carboxypeptidase C (Cathepsin A) n=1 Tax=Caulobacter ginsengisoli TaxID=400775 RepID=A0ABU0IY77_9CAUL|nr:peptidase S10 [Caulobacter ginsengisoli]MDQ0466960.1 carboxypeptidase C (cathepsin A) [Caulobacter ginsengisoli]